MANAQDTSDVFAWISRPGMPPEDSKILIDEVVYQADSQPSLKLNFDCFDLLYI